MINPIISVIIPVYNVERYIKKCIDSVVNQTFIHFEIIIVNDCSTDNSEQIIFEYKKKDDRIIYVKNEKNLGLGGARNEGLKYCKSKFVLFLDSDDWLEINTIKILVDEITNNDTDIDIFIFGMYKYFERNMKRKIMYQPEAATFKENFEIAKNFLNPFNNPFLISACNKLYKKRLFDNEHNLFPKRLFYEDLSTTFKLILSSKKIVILPHILYNYLLRDGSITKQITTKHIDDIFIASEQMQYFIAQNYSMYSDLLPRFFFHHVIIRTLDKVLLTSDDNQKYFKRMQKNIKKLTFNKLGERETKIINEIQTVKSINAIKWIIIKSLSLKKASMKQKFITILSRLILYRFPFIYKFYISK